MPVRRLRCVFLILVLLAVGIPRPAGAQDASSLDVRLLLRIHRSDAPVLARTMDLADRSAYPVFGASLPAAWAAVLVSPDWSASDAGALTATVLGTFGTAIVVKRILGRERPYQRFRTVTPRTGHPGTRNLSPTASMPSAHAALASGIATSLALARPSPWTIAPGAVWAGSVAVSRVWLGVHYPSDVLAGTLLGAGVAVAVHALIKP